MANIDNYMAEKTQNYNIKYMTNDDITNEIYYWLKKYPDNNTIPASIFMRLAGLIDELEKNNGQ